MKTLVLNAADLEYCLNLDELRLCMASALRSLSLKQSTNFPRTVINLQSSVGIGFMPALNYSDNAVGYKVVTVSPKNAEYGINPHQGVVMLLDEKTYAVKCMLDGSTVTALRTAAVSALATDLLSRTDSTHLALIGTGRQAIEHLRAISKVRNITHVSVYARSSESAKKYMNAVKDDSSINMTIEYSPKVAIRHADIVVTCTPSTLPILDINDFREGTHINAIGASRPGQSEINLNNHPLLKIYLDSEECCTLESDEIYKKINSNELNRKFIVGELGDCIDHKVDRRKQSNEITFFKSVGLGIEDLFAASYFYDKAKSLNIGQIVMF